MADNYLENQYERYLARKAAWERERKYGKKKKSVHPRPLPQQAEDDVVTDSEEVMLHPFHTSVTDIPLPEKFTYPFCYTPHPLCIAAVKEMQDYLGRQDRWKEELAQGKMFGVLVVETDKGEIGYLAAFSGILAGKTCILSLYRPCTTCCNRKDSSKQKKSKSHKSTYVSDSWKRMKHTDGGLSN